MIKIIQRRTLGLTVVAAVFLGYWLGGYEVISNISGKSSVSAETNARLADGAKYSDKSARTSLASSEAGGTPKPEFDISDPRWVKMAQYLVKTPLAIERAERAKNQKLDSDNRSFLMALGLSDEEATRIIELVHERDLLYNKMTMQLMSEGDMLSETKRFRRKLIDEAQDAKNQEIANELGGREQFNEFARWEESKPVRDQIAHVARSANLSISPDAAQGLMTALINAKAQIAEQGIKTQSEFRAMVMTEQIRLHTSNLLSREEQQRFIDHLNP